MKQALGVALAAGMALSGCGIADAVGSGARAVASPILGTGIGSRRGVAEIDGVRFRSRVQVTSEDRRSFITSTPGAERAPVQAAEAGRTQAITYCLRNFGGSQIQWTVGPDVPAEDIALEADGGLLLTGRCVTR